jgi:hypothetical protein
VDLSLLSTHKEAVRPLTDRRPTVPHLVQIDAPSPHLLLFVLLFVLVVAPSLVKIPGKVEEKKEPPNDTPVFRLQCVYNISELDTTHVVQVRLHLILGTRCTLCVYGSLF